MGYYVSNMIGIRTGGVFSGETDMEDLKKRIYKIIEEIRSEENEEWSDIDLYDGSCDYAMSHELISHKGTYVVIAGVFNYWTWNKSSEFSRRLSKEFGTEIMHMCWNEERNEVQCNIFLDGKPLFEVCENPIGRILRRVI